MLHSDSDREYLLEGIQHGFQIVDSSQISSCIPATTANYVPGKHSAAVESAILQEIQHGHYQRVVSPQHPPTLINAIGCVPKSDGSVRLIHDLSRPHEHSANDLAPDMACKLDSLENVCNFIQPGDFMCKLDLRSAYRVVNLHPSNHAITGLKWRFQGEAADTLLYDTRLPFGARLSPAIFNRITQSVCRYMHRAGFTRTFVYIGDFLIVESSHEAAATALKVLLYQLRKLGFWIAYEKMEGPCQKLVYLGAELDSLFMSVHLTPARLQKLHAEITATLARKRSSLRQLLQLTGKLNFACVAVRGGRAFLRRLHDAARALLQPHHRMKHDEHMLADLQWWNKCMRHYNGKHLPLHPADLSRPLACISADACTEAAGAFFNGDWFYCAWSADLPQLSNLPICYKEAAALCLAADRWAHCWKGCHVIMHSDSTVATSIVPRLTCSEPKLMPFLRHLFHLSEHHNFTFEVNSHHRLRKHLFPTQLRGA